MSLDNDNDSPHTSHLRQSASYEGAKCPNNGDTETMDAYPTHSTHPSTPTTAMNEEDIPHADNLSHPSPGLLHRTHPMEINNNGASTTAGRKSLKTKKKKKLTMTDRSDSKDHSGRSSGSADHHAVIKYGSLLLLVGQMVGLVLLMRYSRTHLAEGELYLASTAVFMMEIMKFTLCLLVVFHQTGSSILALTRQVQTHVCSSPTEMLKLCVPSLLYTIQNNLLYVALTNLDAATYQILYQLKILTTALFSATMLQRRFSRTKWSSLVVLTVGVAVVQLSGSSDSKNSKSTTNEDEDRNRWVGLAAVLCAACTSGFSGVYFEKILKGSETSLWIRNIQMGIPSMMIALITVFVEDGEQISQKGFFVGYSPMVATVITVQAVGGLIVAVVVKYADNVLKVFCSSFSILLSCLISAVVFDFRPNGLFLVGACLVVLSSVMYSKPEGKKRVGRKRGQVLPVSHGGKKTSV